MNFSKVKDYLSESFQKIDWIAESGMQEEELKAKVQEIEAANPSRAIAKAKTFELLVTQARIAVDRYDIFQDKVQGFGIMVDQRNRWEQEVKQKFLAEEAEEAARAWNKLGTYEAHGDYGHISPNSRLLLSVGFAGLLERVEKASGKEGLSAHQKEFYFSCQIVLRAMMTAANRLADAVEPYNPENAVALRNIAAGAPQNSYDAMQLLILYFFLHEYVAGARVRTLGRLDVLLEPFYQKDVQNGTFTKAEIKELLQYFLYKFWSAKVPFDLPLCLGGIDENGRDVTGEMTWLVVETYDELNIYSPKIHIRVSEQTPKEFVKRVLDCIRRGNSSFVFVNDHVAMESLIRVGISPGDARDYVPIGCYEPAVWGVEIGCTGNGGVNLPKAIELMFTGGRDWASGTLCGLSLKTPSTYEEFLDGVKQQIAYLTEKTVDYIRKIEKYYGIIHPDPILSCQYDQSVELGVDVYESGAKYNNSSLYYYSIASLVDSLCAVKTLVFDRNIFTFEAFGDILKVDWKGYEKERLLAKHLPEKYGNGDPYADELAKELSRYCASLVNNRPNGRGGVFKAALFSIDFCFRTGKRTMATPDGRRAGEPLSKNLCASVGMDRKGITALIQSVTNMDLADFSTGSVLDILLHPSAVSGEEGLETFYAVLNTYFKRGGMAMHGNIFDAEILKKAQDSPEVYQNLQVRVCGWNAYFVNLSKEEQDCFIRQAEGVI